MGPVILQSHARILHQCGGLKNHTTVLSEVNSRRVNLFNKQTVQVTWVPVVCSVFFLSGAGVRFLPRCVVLGESVLAAGGAAIRSCLGRTEKHTLTAWLAGGIAHPPLSSRGFCSTPQSRFSWVRSARRDEEQVFLLRCQGDADWFPGQVSQYIYIYIYIYIFIINLNLDLFQFSVLKELTDNKCKFNHFLSWIILYKITVLLHTMQYEIQ